MIPTSPVAPVTLVLLALSRLAAAQPSAPPNASASVTIEGHRIRLSYENRDIFAGTIGGTDTQTVFQSLVDSAGGTVVQVLKWTSFSGSRLSLRGQVLGSAESFPAEADRREDGLAIVRHSLGLSRSLLNRAVYDRTRDWVISLEIGRAHV